MRPRILAVWTRDLDGTESIGRVNTARAVRDAMAAHGRPTHLRLYNLLERPRPGRLAAAAWALLLGLLRGRPLPLQCALFTPGPEARIAARGAAECTVLYADGIRPLLLLRRLRRRFPEVALVVDIDDLLSRRFDEMLERQLPLSLGYLDGLLPHQVARMTASSVLARAVLRYERMALRHAEQEIIRLADRVVLVNRHEADLLAEATAAWRGKRRACARIEVIPPPVRPATQSALRPPWRAVFVGTDGLVQNRLTIDYLLDLWERHRLPLPLFIYGRQKRPPRPVPNVTWPGYVEDIAEVYAPGSILVGPSFVRGGIKTKILEAFAHGVPVAGNPAAFEGLDLPGYPLCFAEEAELLRFLCAPQDHVQDMARAVEEASRYLAREHAPEVFRARWGAAIAGPPLLRAATSEPGDDRPGTAVVLGGRLG